MDDKIVIQCHSQLSTSISMVRVIWFLPIQSLTVFVLYVSDNNLAASSQVVSPLYVSNSAIQFYTNSYESEDMKPVSIRPVY